MLEFRDTFKSTSTDKTGQSLLWDVMHLQS